MVLQYYSNELFKCLLVGFILICTITIYAYRVNMRRPANDPKKRNYHPFALILVPLTLPIIIPVVILLFIATAMLYAGFIVLFTILLITLRKPFLFTWWHKFATLVGDPILRLNSYLIMWPFAVSKS